MVARDYGDDRDGLHAHFAGFVEREALDQALAYVDRFPDEIAAMLAENARVETELPGFRAARRETRGAGCSISGSAVPGELHPAERRRSARAGGHRLDRSGAEDGRESGAGRDGCASVAVARRS
jgi:hypothetical protein